MIGLTSELVISKLISSLNDLFAKISGDASGVSALTSSKASKKDST